MAALNKDLDREMMPDENNVLAVALEICSASELSRLNITADHQGWHRTPCRLILGAENDFLFSAGGS
jgi:hypothetical protein